jgi:hypothetical protein
MRHFIRHPADIPIEVSASDQLAHATRHAHNVSLGGLAFQSDYELGPGMLVEVRIPFVRPAFETKARVVWCGTREDGFELGVEFLDPEERFGRVWWSRCAISRITRRRSTRRRGVS